MTPNVRPIIAALLLAALAAGCGGGDGDAPTAPEPATRRQVFDFAWVEVIEDCDGAEGDGDFEFEVIVTPSNAAFDLVYRGTVNLGPGGQVRGMGLRGYSFDATGSAEITVRFGASELDRSIVGVEYPDDRLANASGSKSHVHENGQWSNRGEQFITLGSAECLVRLRYTAL